MLSLISPAKSICSHLPVAGVSLAAETTCHMHRCRPFPSYAKMHQRFGDLSGSGGRCGSVFGFA
jgi:hypothetical protein